MNNVLINPCKVCFLHEENDQPETPYLIPVYICETVPPGVVYGVETNQDKLVTMKENNG